MVKEIKKVDFYITDEGYEKMRNFKSFPTKVGAALDVDADSIKRWLRNKEVKKLSTPHFIEAALAVTNGQVRLSKYIKKVV